MELKILPTTVVGSYPQPEWLIDREKFMAEGTPPRIRLREIWRVPESFLEQAQDDATTLAVREMERAGIDVVSDGEIRRESYSNRYATALDGVEIDPPGETVNRSGRKIPVPRVTGPIRRGRPVQVRDVAFLRAQTDRLIKATVPGPFTMSVQAQNEHYASDEEMAMDYAAAVNEEVKEMFAAGADIVQLDEPWMQARPESARKFAVKAINRALEGVSGTTAIHMCFGYAHSVKNKPSGYSFLPELEATAADHISIEAAQPGLPLSILKKLPSKKIMVGVISMGDETPETPETVAGRIREALRYISPERLIVAPDCGMKYLLRDLAFQKLRAMVEGAEIVRREIS